MDTADSSELRSEGERRVRCYGNIGARAGERRGEKEGSLRDGVVRAELHEGMRLQSNDVGEQVLARERQVLNDNIVRVVGVLDTRNGLRNTTHQAYNTQYVQRPGDLQCSQHVSPARG